MLTGSSTLAFILVLASMFILLYFSMTYLSDNTIPIFARLTQEEAIRIVENDFRTRQTEFDRISGIIVNDPSGYTRIEEFHEKNLTLPLVYVHPNNTLIRITDDGLQKMGECKTGLEAYCAYLQTYNFDYSGRLVYGLDVLLSNKDHPSDPECRECASFLYVIDAVSGEIVDSTFLRNEAHRKGQYSPPVPVLTEEEQELASVAKNIQGLKNWSPDEWRVSSIGYLGSQDAIVYLWLPLDARAPAYCELGWIANVRIGLETKEVVSAFYPTDPSSTCSYGFSGPVP